MGHLLGYARISTTDQQPQLQVDALERAGCYRVFTETASGARTDRPTLEQLLDQLRPGDTLIVWKLDRLGRSLRHLVDTVTGLADRGIGFRSLQEAIDTTTPGGKLVFYVFAALAEFERDLIRERTAAGLAAARARGRHGGRPPVLTGQKLRVAQEMYASGQYTLAAIATTLGVSRASIYRHLRQSHRVLPLVLHGSWARKLLPVESDGGDEVHPACHLFTRKGAYGVRHPIDLPLIRPEGTMRLGETVPKPRVVTQLRAKRQCLKAILCSLRSAD
jgi:DNA invertase Pin-like site-specific DNA recombinase